jgi:Bifunctional DNA primase/polymerase, N-terminal
MTGETIASAFAGALMLASEGRPCFPCAGSKRPTASRGFLDATTDPMALRQLWSKCPGPLVGVRTGNASGIDVLDFDRKHRQAVGWWTAHRDDLPVTRVHRTRSGGLHLLLQHAPDMRCSASKIALGIDVRGDGGYVIWWPIAGLPVLCDAPLAPWPEWLRIQLLSPQRPVAVRPTVPDTHALARLVRLLAGAREGERNDLTYWAACRAGEMVASGLFDADVAVALIAEAATRAGLPRAEAERTARSGIRTGGGLRRG